MTMLLNINEINNDPPKKTACKQACGVQETNAEAVSMNKHIVSLTKQHKNCAYLTNTLVFRCNQCNSKHKESYYDILVNGNFILQNPVNTITTYIREGEYEEDVTVTPIVANKVCIECNNKMIFEFPISLEYLLVILQSHPPDPSLYG